MAFVDVAATARAAIVPKGTASTNSTVNEVVKAFNTWAFKREQPSDINLLTTFVSDAVRRAEPLSFVAYWGKGPRDEIAEPDLQCLRYLQQMMRRIEEVHAPGAELHLVLTDSHARLNGHKMRNITRYFSAIDGAAQEFGFSTWRLKNLTDSMKPSLKLTSCSGVEYPKAILSELEKSAAKWYRGGKAIDVGARRYFDMNMIERRVIERVFPTSIFLTFNSSDLSALFPQKLPIFYMYSIKKGVGVKPWFQSGSTALAGGVAGNNLSPHVGSM
jgi:hypothetical protein